MIASNSRSNSNLNKFKFTFELENNSVRIESQLESLFFLFCHMGFHASRIIWPASLKNVWQKHSRKSQSFLVLLSYIEPKLIIIILHLRLSDPVFLPIRFCHTFVKLAGQIMRDAWEPMWQKRKNEVRKWSDENEPIKTRSKTRSKPTNLNSNSNSISNVYDCISHLDPA